MYRVAPAFLIIVLIASRMAFSESPPGFDTTVTQFTYALFICVQSAMSCGPVTSESQGVNGIRHSLEIYAKESDCRALAHEKSKATADEQGRFVVSSTNRWYECRRLDAKANNDLHAQYDSN